MTFRFVHAADLHLDCPFEGLTRSTDAVPGLAQCFRDATLSAFDALIELCLARDASFLVLSGDVYDAEERSLRAVFRLRDGLCRLASAGIRSFVAHGNHDPAGVGVPAFTWPESVCIFPAERVETVDVSIGSRPVASVSGISYGRRAEGRDLAALFPRPGESPFSIAVLHANAGSQPGHAPYAPCTVESLRSAGYDYWALGHVHGHAVLCRDPMIVYPGCTQGLSVRESGPKGCVVVDVGDGGAVQTEFVSLAPVRWETVSVACQAAETVDAFEERALAQIEDACTGAAGCDVLIVRLSVTASGSVYDLLADDDDAAADLLDHLRDQLGARTSPRCWLKDMRVESRLTPLGVAEGMQRQDFLGEVFRVSAELAEKESDVRVELLARLNELFGSRHARHALKSLSDDEITQILAEARLVCTQLLGN